MKDKITCPKCFAHLADKDPGLQSSGHRVLFRGDKAGAARFSEWIVTSTTSMRLYDGKPQRKGDFTFPILCHSFSHSVVKYLTRFWVVHCLNLGWGTGYRDKDFSWFTSVILSF